MKVSDNSRRRLSSLIINMSARLPQNACINQPGNCKIFDKLLQISQFISRTASGCVPSVVQSESRSTQPRPVHVVLIRTRKPLHIRRPIKRVSLTERRSGSVTKVAHNPNNSKKGVPSVMMSDSRAKSSAPHAIFNCSCFRTTGRPWSLTPRAERRISISPSSTISR